MKDGKAVEAVFMKYKYGNSVCISSQAGRRMGCAFCASGMNGLERDLTAGEMYGEILAMEKATGEKISHLVVMGTGEPFDNYENLSKFIRIMNDPSGKNLGMRNITVSTCGLIPVIDRFGDDFPQVNLAISLHAADSEERSEIMPVNRAYPLADLIEACRRYTEKTGRRITFEYTLIHGVNDDRGHLDKLVSLLHGMLCHVNLIPLNAVKEKGFVPGTRERAEEFRDALEKRGIPATVRRELGSDIDAACGQLRLKN
jgi:23S rRNA (adenine2503-C2)-methyltransferase